MIDQRKQQERPMKYVLAVIPARGGSKGIPRKNVLPLCGRPLIAWTIKAAQRARSVNRILVSTDDREVADVSRQFGAEVMKRPAAISGDRSSSEAALLHVLDSLRKREGYEPDILVLLQCTAPLTSAEDIDGTVGVLMQRELDSAVAVVEFHHFLWEEIDGSFVGINHDKNVRLMRQDRMPQYLETGAVYAMRSHGFVQAKHRFFGKTGHYIMTA